MIQFVSGEYPPDVGGVGDYTLRLRSALSDLGQESTVVSRRNVGHWDARAVLQVARTAPQRGIVHIQFQAGAFDLLGDICLLPGLLRLARPAIRTVTTFHDTRVPYLFARAGRLRPAAVQLLARSSHAVIAADREDLQALGGLSERHHYIPIGPNVACSPPPGYDRTAFRSTIGLRSDDLAVVYFGLLNASKGLDLLVATFQRVLERKPATRLLMLGGAIGASDPTDVATAAAVAAGIARFGSRVIRTGWLAPRELSAHLLAGDVALLPYVDGASGRRGSLLACAEHRLPIVSTQPASVEVANFVCAVPPDPVALAEAVLRVAAAPDEPRAKSQQLAQLMSWPRIAAEHAEVYRRLLYFGA